MYFSLKLEVVKIFVSDNYRNTFSYKITIKIWGKRECVRIRVGREWYLNESGKGVEFLKSVRIKL